MEPLLLKIEKGRGLLGINDRRQVFQNFQFIKVWKKGYNFSGCLDEGFHKRRTNYIHMQHHWGNPKERDGQEGYQDKKVFGEIRGDKLHHCRGTEEKNINRKDKVNY